MQSNKPPSEAAFARAAELRALGNTWEVVAQAVHRSPETVRRWPQMYGQRWWDALHEAEQHIASEASGESVRVLRQLLRSDDDRIRWHAAAGLTRFRLELAKLALRIAAQLNLNNPTEAQLLLRLLEISNGYNLPAAPAGADPTADRLPPREGEPVPRPGPE